ncbi:MAG TPA: hypothetical protein VGQ65_09580 [Thermoanaerobaculia bacterium]|jgi:hypothetical protein|nr:hypothetical protein [Thermoanaerobaculia bacterium]
MESRFVTFVTSSAVFMTVLLLLDRDGFPKQLALGAATPRRLRRLRHFLVTLAGHPSMANL